MHEFAIIYQNEFPKRVFDVVLCLQATFDKMARQFRVFLFALISVFYFVLVFASVTSSMSLAATDEVTNWFQKFIFNQILIVFMLRKKKKIIF